MSPTLVALAVALVAVPGAALAILAFPPGRASLGLRVALVAPFGFCLVGAAGLVLTLGRVMTRPVFLGTYAGLTALAWAVVGLRRNLPEHLRAWRGDISADPWAYAAGTVVTLAFAAIRLRYSPVANLNDQTPFRYWGDGLEIAATHHIPAATLQWGQYLFPSTISKVVMNSFDAGASFVLGRGPLGPMGALLFVVAVGLLLGAMALGRTLGLRLTAPVLALALFADHVFNANALTTDLVTFKAENFGRLLVLAAVTLAVRSLWKGRRDAVLAAVLFGLATATHLIPVTVGAAFVIAYLLAWAALTGRLRDAAGTGWRLAAVGGAIGVFLLIAPGGTLGFQGATDTSAYARLAAELHQPPTWDPTLFLTHGTVVQQVSSPVDGFYQVPLVTYHYYVQESVGQDPLLRPFLVLLPIAYLVGLAVLLLWGDRRLRALGLSAVALAAVLLLTGLAFSYHYRLFAMAEFGPRRLFNYGVLPLALVAVGVLEVILRRGVPWALGRWSPGGTARRTARVGGAAGLVVAVVAAALMLPGGVPSARYQRFLATGLGPLHWIERSVPCDGRVLADRRTLGTFETLTRHAGVLEGMGPYLRPQVLTTAIRQLLAARAFFRDPAAHQAYLRRQGVAAVVVSAPAQGIGGATRIAPADASALARLPWLRVAARSRSVTVYRYTGFNPPAASRLPPVAGRPGFDCPG